MIDEKKKLEKDALNEEQVSAVSGGNGAGGRICCEDPEDELHAHPLGNLNGGMGTENPVVHYDDPEDELHAYPMGRP